MEDMKIFSSNGFRLEEFLNLAVDPSTRAPDRSES